MKREEQLRDPTEWIEIGQQGIVNARRIVAVGGAQPAGMKRLLGAVSQERIVDLTGGRRRQSLLVLDTTHLVLTALPVEEVGRLLNAASGEKTGTVSRTEMDSANSVKGEI